MGVCGNQIKTAKFSGFRDGRDGLLQRVRTVELK